MLKLGFNRSAPESIVSEERIAGNRHRIKPIPPRISNYQRKKGPTIFGYVRSKDPRFMRLVTHAPKGNWLSYKAEITNTLQKGMHSLNKNFKHLHSLQKFSLDVAPPDQKLTDADLYYLSRTLKRPISLQSLELTSCSQITDRGLYYIGRVMKRMSSLKHFDLSLKYFDSRFPSNQKITDKGLIYLSKKLERLTSLERLTVDLKCRSRFCNFGVSVFSVCLQKLTLLRDLTISFSSSPKITQQAFLVLCNSIERLGCLQNLSLDLKGIAVSDVGLRRFGEMARKLICLRSLAITLTNRGVDSKISELFNGLKELVALQSLKIDYFCDAMTSNNRHIYLSETLKRLVHLKNLEIGFDSKYGNFDDVGLSSLRSGLKRLEQLERLKLNFTYSSQISDKGLDELGKGLEHLTTSLQEISVRFTSSEQVTDEGARGFCEGFKNFTNLRRFGFLIERCPNFTDNGRYMICQVLKDAPSLEVLSFWGCDLAGKDKIVEASKYPKMYFENYRAAECEEKEDY